MNSIIDRLPSGISLKQAKKDAKKISISQGIARSAALDVVAREHCQSTWNELLHQLSLQYSVSLQFAGGNKFKLPKGKSTTICVGPSGSGKSVLLTEFAKQLLAKGIKVVFLTTWGEDLDKKVAYIPLPAKPLTINCDQIYPDDVATWNCAMLQRQYPTTFAYYAIHPRMSLTSIELNGAVVMIDEPELFLDQANSPSFIKLLRGCFRTFWATQSHELVVREFETNHDEVSKLQVLFSGNRLSLDLAYKFYLDCPQPLYDRFSAIGGFKALIDSMPDVCSKEQSVVVNLDTLQQFCLRSQQ